MAYKTIRLIGGPYHGRDYHDWAGEGLFPVRFWEPNEAAPMSAFDPRMNEAKTTQPPVPLYTVQQYRCEGFTYTYAIPVNMAECDVWRAVFGMPKEW